MGDFTILVKGNGGHGCARETKNGQPVEPCRQQSCPDCQARTFVGQLQDRGCQVKEATLIHWPGEAGEVRDDLLTGIRTGQFSEAGS